MSYAYRVLVSSLVSFVQHLLLCESSTTGYVAQNLELKLTVQFSFFFHLLSSYLLNFIVNKIKQKTEKLKRDRNRKLLDVGVGGLFMFSRKQNHKQLLLLLILLIACYIQDLALVINTCTCTAKGGLIYLGPKGKTKIKILYLFKYDLKKLNNT